MGMAVLGGPESLKPRGEEIFVNRKFTWAGGDWDIPAIYLCKTELVVDVSQAVTSEEIRAYSEKWCLEEEKLSPGERRAARAENPLRSDLSFQARVNGRALPNVHFWSVAWIPQKPMGRKNSEKARLLMEQYGYPPEFARSFFRVSFPRPHEKQKKISSLEIGLSVRPSPSDGPCFSAENPGEKVAFTLPVGKKEYTLTVLSCVPGELPKEMAAAHGTGLPVHYQELTYTLSPQPPKGTVSLRDCCPGDTVEMASSAEAFSMGIIGGADGPTAIITLDGERGKEEYTALSSLYDSPGEKVKWKFVFYEKTCEDITLELI